MYPRPLLSLADSVQLRSLIHSELVPPSRRNLLSDFLASAGITDSDEEVYDRVALYDRVTLVSPIDSRDWFKLTIVPPEEADERKYRMSVFDDISRAVLGRRCGERVSWEAPPGLRRMSIAALAKSDAFVR